MVPELEQAEYKREREFYIERGLPCPKDLEAETEKDEQQKREEMENQTPDMDTNMDFHRFDEQALYQKNRTLKILMIILIR